MSPDERRQAIIEATRPLLVSGGGQFTIKEVAEAAGIAEGTIFRVFASKQEIINAVVADVLDTGSLCRRIAALPDQPDFTIHLAALIAILTEDVDATHAAFTAARLGGCDPVVPPPPHQKSSARPDGHGGMPHPEHHRRGKNGFQERNSKVREAIIASLQPWASRLRLPVEQAAFLIQSTAFSALHFVFDDRFLSDPALLADTLTYGIYSGHPDGPTQAQQVTHRRNLSKD